MFNNFKRFLSKYTNIEVAESVSILILTVSQPSGIVRSTEKKVYSKINQHQRMDELFYNKHLNEPR
jgi:hypothetical protein